jgi:thermitase
MVAAGWIIVAAAGNNSSCRPAWPAALSGVVAVGAISRCAPAWFSNFGPWVDVSAPGVDIVAEFPNLSGEGAPLGDSLVGQGYRFDPAGAPQPLVMLQVRDFDTGWARWSGTSFAAPFVAARLATRFEEEAVPADPVTRLQVRDQLIDALIGDRTYDWLPDYGRLLV